MSRPPRPGASPPPALYGKPDPGLRRALYTIIFEADTRAGCAFDLTLIVAILASVAVVIMDSVRRLSSRYGGLFDLLEWDFTLLFTAEYLARLWCVRRPSRYAQSLLGIIDLLAFLPSHLALLFPQAVAVQGVRALRLLRIDPKRTYPSARC
jgi:voltage-gated potassium channel